MKIVFRFVIRYHKICKVSWPSKLECVVIIYSFLLNLFFHIFLFFLLRSFSLLLKISWSLLHWQVNLDYRFVSLNWKPLLLLFYGYFTSLCKLFSSFVPLQVLAASKNKISTLKGFPHVPLLEVSILSITIILHSTFIEGLINWSIKKIWH